MRGNHAFIHTYPTGNRLEQASQSQSKRGFSHAVFAGQGGNLAGMEREVHMLAKRKFTPEAEILGSQNNISQRLIRFGNMAFNGTPRNPGTAFC